MPIQALPGFRDFYPDDFLLRAHIFETWRLVAERYGFEEYDGPPLEPLELYTAKSGEEIVGQLYNFVDKGDRPVALRPEMTPTLARMVAARANGLKKPIRWFSIPQLFRYERQQRGRLREHFQLNCDLIGEPSPLADAEIIALAIDVIRAFGLSEKDVRVRVSDRRVLETYLLGKGIPADSLGVVYQAIDKVDRMKPDQWRLLLRESLDDRMADLVFRATELRSWPGIEKAVSEVAGGEVAIAPLRSVVDALKAMGLGGFVDVDLTIVRGLAYYTGTVFELFDAEKKLRAICGGGRYDNLAGAVGGVDLPAVGFGFGDVVLGELLKDKGLVPTHRSSIDVFIAAITGDDVPHALKLAHDLRDQGYRVEYVLSGGAVGKQLKLADSRNARVAIVIGPDDRARGEVMVKDLAAKTQKSVPLADVLAALSALKEKM
ncbi:MAG TPA: histidine--tRNA ligase [Gemmatimonadales bacterium]|jgi:histidyl-tRNA synthetase|nr:histidine--tRNA ligase [Gemmatimonadales bacterium]